MMDFSGTTWEIPGKTEYGNDLSRRLTEWGFIILETKDMSLRVTPPAGWTGEITKQELWNTWATVFDQSGNRRLECQEGEDLSQLAPVYFAHSNIVLEKDFAARNRAVIAQLTWQLKTFTLDQIYNKFQEVLGPDRWDYVGEGMRLRDQIEELVELGALRKDFDTYTTI